MLGNIFQIRSDALPPGATLLAFRGEEAISRPYVLEVGIQVDGGLEVDLAAAVHTRFTLVADRGPTEAPQVWSGIAAAFELLHEQDGSSVYRAVLVPVLWQLGLTEHSRVFTDATVPEILRAVLED